MISVGDGIWDLKTARKLGYEFIGIAEGRKAEALREMGAQVFENFHSLLEVWEAEWGDASRRT